MKTTLFQLLLFSLSVNGFTQTTLYQQPRDYDYANDFKVRVNGRESFVYNNRVAAFTCFAIDGETTIEVEFFGKIYELDIRPKSLNIIPRIEEGKIIFTLSKPCNISVEINKNLKRPLFVFANPVETRIPSADAANVHFFEGGKIHHTGRITLKDNDIVYIQGGAIVKGSLFLDNIRNVRIFGHGILDGECVYGKGQERMIEINRCENVQVEGIIINDSRHWTAPCNKSKYVTFRNISVDGEMFPPSLLLGYDDSHTIENVTFENFRVFGKVMTSTGDLKATLEFTGNISFHQQR